MKKNTNQLPTELPARSMKETAGLKICRPKDVQQALGISESAYYRLVNNGLLPYTRLTPGGDRVHLEEHIAAYRNYLLSQTKGDKRVWAPRHSLD